MGRNLGPAWAIINNWHVREPVEDRRPLPLALAQALMAFGILFGQHLFAACIMLALFGPGRVGEGCSRFDPISICMNRLIWCCRPLRIQSLALAEVLLHSSDLSDLLLLRSCCRIYFGICAVLTSSGLCLLALSAKLRLCRVLVCHPRCFYHEAFRGGGTASLYCEDVGIQDLMWKLRLQQPKTLAHYLQKVSAVASLVSITQGAKQNIEALASAFDALSASS